MSKPATTPPPDETDKDKDKASEKKAEPKTRSPQVTLGRTVIYILSQDDEIMINRRRTNSATVQHLRDNRQFSPGVQAHIGSNVAAGEEVVAVVTRVIEDNTVNRANLKLQLDGSDTLWVKGAAEDPDKQRGTWHFPERK